MLILNINFMKKLKKLSRENMKNVKGASYEDMCQPGDGTCEQYGLQCRYWIGEDHAVGVWHALRCG